MISSVKADTWTQIACNSTDSCPEDSPCCSQYGYCGTGSYCLGGCDPRYSFNLTACMPQPRMSSFTEDFSDTSVVIKGTSYLGNATDTDWVYTGYIASYDDALLMQMPNGSTGTVVSSTKYLWFGKVGATMKSSHDNGVITAFITFSDVQDEIDYEFLGYNLTFPQNNYYSKGILNYSNTGDFEVTDTFENWHYYEIDWQEEKITWSVDGVEVRTLEKELTWNSTTDRYDFPSTPSRIQFSLWPGGSSLNALGTIEWAGGEIDWDSDDIKDIGYYYASVKNVSVTTYDLPSFLDQSSVNYTDYHAFLYNSTDGDETDIYLTNAKTWLGSSDATGIDPDNDDEEDLTETSTLLVLSGSTTYTSTSVKTKSTSAQDPAQDTGTTTSTSTSENTGGFVQNTKATSSLSADSASTSGQGPKRPST
ncbi:hypothetical protein METBIDRAFT_77118 [Metschnikowia bicuspidata var. bicuspidata NRRL YB-4993]|uniref:Crh-like protein n=1 Tax=Metschnikowia bicuspidata var. bicuspidata NRRL YB-4993 TaxID=869754 RepID=A0A1A0HK78_9ASCO|nr:hypothetical protein METBIDRAFT_77118 [Metschnikowia bicuspidata var. bicuspidata NRRL YB-4993]OBA24292.1 hypothetical protein METBIDRAFT_77118 [Metschnikowia bicuspidata var. bicuspidata NRRL YB-4993]